ncbi:MAG: DUF975 family protein [Candidatus Kaiserbacteria bacterium]|nr:DUF975 family protein [Candidatus Kaiserbacteria bacterium]
MNTLNIKNAVLMKQARESLAGKWGLAVGTFAVYLLIIAVVSSLRGYGSIVSLVISGPFAFGIASFALAISRNKEARLEQLFEGFKRFGRSLATNLLMILFILLWALLLIVPGIIAAISYSQTFFILADDETIGARDAIKKSKKMMYGYKWKYFCLGLRFIGWGLLSILTLGIGFLWLFPYVQVSMAKFHDAIKGSNKEE